VLAEDIAARLDTVGHVTALHRRGVAPFLEERCTPLATLESLSLAERHALLKPVDAALSGWRRFDLAPTDVAAFRQGQSVWIGPQAVGGGAALNADARSAAATEAPQAPVRVYAEGPGFLGLGALQPEGRLRPLRLIASG